MHMHRHVHSCLGICLDSISLSCPHISSKGHMSQATPLGSSCIPSPSIFFPFRAVRVSVRVSLQHRAVAMDAGAVAMDSEDGKSYSSRKEMWLQEAGEDAETGRDPDLNKKDEWYQNGIKYWKGVEATVDGVLGGYGNVSSWDVMESDRFLLDVLSECMPDYVRGNRHLVALDCGAGVGRITKQLLLRHFHEVDLVEPVQHFLETARRDLKSHILESNVIQDHNLLHRVVNFFATPLQNFTPEPNRYDVIWVQWCIGHLTDQDFIAFFLRAKVGLKPDGLFVLKENVSKCDFLLDKADSSVSRSDAYFRDLMKQTGLHLQKTRAQQRFPRELLGVRMYALTQSPVPVVPLSNRTRSKKLSNQPRTIY